MKLVPYTDEDMWLTETLETDPRVMAELGGPWPPEKIPGIHQRRIAAIGNGGWNLKIVPDSVSQPVGAVMIWHSEFEGQPISEAGWMIIPEHQGRGYASEALRLALELADADGKWGDIHAFPGISNGPSNALCRKFGFELVGEFDVDYGGRPLRVNHWIRRRVYGVVAPRPDSQVEHAAAHDQRPD